MVLGQFPVFFLPGKMDIQIPSPLYRAATILLNQNSAASSCKILQVPLVYDITAYDRV